MICYSLDSSFYFFLKYLLNDLMAHVEVIVQLTFVVDFVSFLQPTMQKWVLWRPNLPSFLERVWLLFFVSF